MRSVQNVIGVNSMGTIFSRDIRFVELDVRADQFCPRTRGLKQSLGPENQRKPCSQLEQGW